MGASPRHDRMPGGPRFRRAVALYGSENPRRPRMTRMLVLALALLSFHAAAAEVERVTRGNLAMEGIPEIPQALIQQLRRYQFARGASFAGWTPDGREIGRASCRE